MTSLILYLHLLISAILLNIFLPHCKCEEVSGANDINDLDEGETDNVVEILNPLDISYNYPMTMYFQPNFTTSTFLKDFDKYSDISINSKFHRISFYFIQNINKQPTLIELLPASKIMQEYAGSFTKLWCNVENQFKNIIMFSSAVNNNHPLEVSIPGSNISITIPTKSTGFISLIEAQGIGEERRSETMNYTNGEKRNQRIGTTNISSININKAASDNINYNVKINSIKHELKYIAAFIGERIAKCSLAINSITSSECFANTKEKLIVCITLTPKTEAGNCFADPKFSSAIQQIASSRLKVSQNKNSLQISNKEKIFCNSVKEDTTIISVKEIERPYILPYIQQQKRWSEREKRKNAKPLSKTKPFAIKTLSFLSFSLEDIVINSQIADVEYGARSSWLQIELHNLENIHPVIYNDSNEQLIRINLISNEYLSRNIYLKKCYEPYTLETIMSSNYRWDPRFKKFLSLLSINIKTSLENNARNKRSFARHVSVSGPLSIDIDQNYFKEIKQRSEHNLLLFCEVKTGYLEYEKAFADGSRGAILYGSVQIINREQPSPSTNYLPDSNNNVITNDINMSSGQTKSHISISQPFTLTLPFADYTMIYNAAIIYSTVLACIFALSVFL